MTTVTELWKEQQVTPHQAEETESQVTTGMEGQNTPPPRSSSSWPRSKSQSQSEHQALPRRPPFLWAPGASGEGLLREEHTHVHENKQQAAGLDLHRESRG
jgi:hypothetical protein